MLANRNAVLCIAAMGAAGTIEPVLAATLKNSLADQSMWREFYRTITNGVKSGHQIESEEAIAAVLMSVSSTLYIGKSSQKTDPLLNYDFTVRESDAGNGSGNVNTTVQSSLLYGMILLDADTSKSTFDSKTGMQEAMFYVDSDEGCTESGRNKITLSVRCRHTGELTPVVTVLESFKEGSMSGTVLMKAIADVIAQTLSVVATLWNKAVKAECHASVGQRVTLIDGTGHVTLTSYDEVNHTFGVQNSDNATRTVPCKNIAQPEGFRHKDLLFARVTEDLGLGLIDEVEESKRQIQFNDMCADFAHCFREDLQVRNGGLFLRYNVCKFHYQKMVKDRAAKYNGNENASTQFKTYMTQLSDCRTMSAANAIVEGMRKDTALKDINKGFVTWLSPLVPYFIKPMLGNLAEAQNSRDPGKQTELAQVEGHCAFVLTAVERFAATTLPETAVATCRKRPDRIPGESERKVMARLAAGEGDASDAAIKGGLGPKAKGPPPTAATTSASGGGNNVDKDNIARNQLTLVNQSATNHDGRFFRKDFDVSNRRPTPNKTQQAISKLGMATRWRRNGAEVTALQLLTNPMRACACVYYDGSEHFVRNLGSAELCCSCGGKICTAIFVVLLHAGLAGCECTSHAAESKCASRFSWSIPALNQRGLLLALQEQVRKGTVVEMKYTEPPPPPPPPLHAPASTSASASAKTSGKASAKSGGGSRGLAAVRDELDANEHYCQIWYWAAPKSRSMKCIACRRLIENEPMIATDVLKDMGQFGGRGAKWGLATAFCCCKLLCFKKRINASDRRGTADLFPRSGQSSPRWPVRQIHVRPTDHAAATKGHTLGMPPFVVTKGAPSPLRRACDTTWTNVPPADFIAAKLASAKAEVMRLEGLSAGAAER
jgi:hypothetical protein